MSVHDLGDGRWEVRWRVGGRQRSTTFHDQNEAEIYDRAIKHAKKHHMPLPTLASGPDAKAIAPATRGFTLNDYFLEPFGDTPSYYERKQARLAKSTRNLEARLWDNHVLQTIGQLELEAISTITIEDWRDDLLDSGIGWSSVQRAQKTISKVLNDANRRGLTHTNPAHGADLPKGPNSKPNPLEPSEIERVAAQLTGKHRLMVRILGYAGTRPSELIGTGESAGVRWQDLRVDDQGRMTMLVRSGKTGQERIVRIVKPLQLELEAHRPINESEQTGLIIPSESGGRWTQTAYRNWRKRQWHPACEKAGIARRRVYDLRHGFASLLLHEGRHITDVAVQLGNGVALAAKTYAHVLNGLTDQPTITAEQAINNARINTTEKKDNSK